MNRGEQLDPLTGEEDQLELVDETILRDHRRDRVGSQALDVPQERLFLDSAEPKAVDRDRSRGFHRGDGGAGFARKPVDPFFEKVTVNDPDPGKRERRLNLLRASRRGEPRRRLLENRRLTRAIRSSAAARSRSLDRGGAQAVALAPFLFRSPDVAIAIARALFRARAALIVGSASSIFCGRRRSGKRRAAFLGGRRAQGSSTGSGRS